MSDGATLQPGDDGASAGALLRRAREAAGLHVATLAVSLKVPVRKLEALEQDRHELLPDAVFARALAGSVCRTLKIDPQPILDRLPQGPAPRLVPDTDGINAPFRGPGDGPGPNWVDRLSRPVPLVVIALLVGVLIIIFLPLRSGESSSDASVARAPVANETTVAVPVSLPAPSAAPMVAAPAAVTPAPVAAASSAAPAPKVASPAPVAAPVAASASSVAAPVAAAAASAAAASQSGVVVFRAKAPSWVQVTDAKGASVLRRLLETGETVGASGALPLSVTVGSVESTEVVVRGKPYNLAPVTRDNVARFEVK